MCMFFGGGQGFLIPGRFVGKFLTQSGGGESGGISSQTCFLKTFWHI